MSEKTAAAGAHVSRLALIGLYRGRLAGTEKARVEAHLGDCPRCAALFAQARETARGFEAEFPTWDSLADSLRLAPSRRARAGAGWRDRLARAWESLAGAASGPRLAFSALLLMAAAVAVFRFAPEQPVGERWAHKGEGDAAFFLFANGRQAGGDTLRCRPSDTLQLGITAPVPVHYAVLYQDDDGEVLAYMADRTGDQTPLGSPDGETLPHSLILKGGWKRELLHCLWSVRPFGLEEAKAAVSRGSSGIGVRTYVLVAAIP